MDLNNVPRWALILIATLGMGACGVLVQNGRAESEKVKVVAYEAKNVSEENTASILELKDSVKDVRLSQEQFRREYREDQKDLNSKLTELLRAVKQ